MAPSAMDTMLAHFRDTGTTPDDYDLIATGDLGKLGSEILIDLMEEHGIKLGLNYNDCGQMYFGRNQNTLSGGSGCGCSATVLNSFIIEKLRRGDLRRVLFMPTGALMSTTASQQGETIPGVCHAIVIESDAEIKHQKVIASMPTKSGTKNFGNKDMETEKITTTTTTSTDKEDGGEDKERPKENSSTRKRSANSGRKNKQ